MNERERESRYASINKEQSMFLLYCSTTTTHCMWDYVFSVAFFHQEDAPYRSVQKTEYTVVRKKIHGQSLKSPFDYRTTVFLLCYTPPTTPFPTDIV